MTTFDPRYPSVDVDPARLPRAGSIKPLRDRSVIEQELADLDLAIAELDGCTNTLLTRLSGILGPMESELAERGHNVPTAKSVEPGRLSARIAVRKQQIHAVCQRLGEMTQALEI